MSGSAIYKFASELTRSMLEDYRVLEQHEFEQAEIATNGNMFTEQKASAMSMFRSHVYTQYYGTEELLDHLKENPRTTRENFERQWLETWLS